MQLLILVTAGLVLCIIVLIIYIHKLKNSYDAIFSNYNNLEALNRKLRMERHDYLNHLQVVYGLLELEEYSELEEYLAPVYKDIMKTGKAIKTSKPAINALISAKFSEAENSGIDMYIEIKSDLKNLNIPDWEICKILSNIIDNAITALGKIEDNKKINLEISETKEEFIFEISNNGPQIPIEKQSDIFKPGITTKNEQGHGMGLYIVKNVCTKNKGYISLNSDNNETAFKITFHK